MQTLHIKIIFSIIDKYVVLYIMASQYFACLPNPFKIDDYYYVPNIQKEKEKHY